MTICEHWTLRGVEDTDIIGGTTNEKGNIQSQADVY